ncbi:MAG: putative beta-lysine N-acetyltransferase [Elusimicrobiota bacterium]
MKQDMQIKEDNMESIRLDEAIDSLESDAFKRVTDEWSGVEPSKKDMGVVQLTLDKGVKTTVIGTVYGLDFEIEGDGYQVNVFFDYYNKRLKILDYECSDYRNMLQRLAWLAETNSFDKIFVKARHEDFQQFLSHGYMNEGILRYYFNGDDAYVLSRFSSAERVSSINLLKESKMIEDIIYNSAAAPARELPSDIRIVTATEEHIRQLVFIYRQVFETYPSPLTNPDYINSVIKRDVHFVLAFKGEEPIAAASADINTKYSNAELTDCATVKDAQGQGLMQFLLLELESLIKRKGIKTSYSLARSLSPGMNKCFFRMKYEYSGRLINNCEIFGEFEDLNIWVKRL